MSDFIEDFDNPSEFARTTLNKRNTFNDGSCYLRLSFWLHFCTVPDQAVL